MSDTVGLESQDLRLMVRAALEGFEAARQRLDAVAAPGARPDAVFAPLAEALWWTVSANDGIEDLAEGGALERWSSKSAYREERDRDSSGRVLAGLRYARDRCGHQLALAALEDGLRLPFRLPNTTGMFFRWRPSDNLPQPRNKQHREQADKMRPAYDTWLSGNPATMTITSAARWFTYAAEFIAG